MYVVFGKNKSSDTSICVMMCRLRGEESTVLL